MLIRIALKQQTVGLIALALAGVLGGVLNALAFIQIAGTTPAERAAFAQQMTLLGAQLSYMLPVPVRIDTLSGYLEWRLFGFIVLVFAIRQRKRPGRRRARPRRAVARGRSRARSLPHHPCRRVRSNRHGRDRRDAAFDLPFRGR